MRALVLLMSVLLLAGCTDSDWANHVPRGAASGYPPDAPPGAGMPQGAPDAAAGANYAAFAAAPSLHPPSITAKCARVAEERRTDTAAQGFDATLQQQVYDKTFADCMEWEAKKAL